MKIRFTQTDRVWRKGVVIDTGKGAALEFVKRGVAEIVEPEQMASEPTKKGKRHA